MQISENRRSRQAARVRRKQNHILPPLGAALPVPMEIFMARVFSSLPFRREPCPPFLPERRGGACSLVPV